MHLSELFENAYRPQRLIGRADGTLIQYRHAIAMFGNPPLDSITDSSFADFMQRRLNEGVSRPTVNKERRHLMALFNFAAKRSLLPRKPDVPPVAEYRRLPRAWTVSDIGRMIAAAKLNTKRFRQWDVSHGDFWTAFILLLFDTGIRKSALLKAKPADADLQRRFIRIHAEHQKRMNEQVLTFSQQTADALAAIAGPWDYLLPWPFDRYKATGWKRLNTHFRRILARAGLSTAGKYFHRFRASRASYGELSAPGSAQVVLGHADIATTRRYLDPLILAESRLVDLLPRPG